MLIKSVAQAIPVYVMSIFMLYPSIHRALERSIRKTHWVAWNKFTKPKCEGGLGFRDLQLFNQALLGRQAWRLIEKPNSLCARVLKAKYYPNGSLLDTAFPSAQSPTWKAMVHGVDLLRKGVCWRIGSGDQVRI